MELVNKVHLFWASEKNSPPSVPWLAIDLKFFGRDGPAEESCGIKHIWPSRIYLWRFPNHPYSSETANVLVHVGRSQRHRRYRNNSSEGLWYLKYDGCPLARLSSYSCGDSRWRWPIRRDFDGLGRSRSGWVLATNEVLWIGPVVLTTEHGVVKLVLDA